MASVSEYQKIPNDPQPQEKMASATPTNDDDSSEKEKTSPAFPGTSSTTPRVTNTDSGTLPKNIPGGGGGMEKGFYKDMMNPFFSRLEETVRKNNEILDEMQRKMDKERDDERKKKLSDHIPETIKGSGRDLKDIMKTLEEMILYENYGQDDEADTSKMAKARLKQLDENAEVAILTHSVAAFVSTLEPSHLRLLSKKMIDDCTLWITRLFRFTDGALHFHEDERDGLVRVCRLVLHQKYPKYASDGFEALFTRPPVIYVSAAARPLMGQHLCTQLGLPLSCIATVPVSLDLGMVQKMDTKEFAKMVDEDKAAGKVPLMVIGYAGTPIVGTPDALDRIHSICKKEEMWLHIEGNNLAILSCYSVPTDVVPARLGHSMTLNLGGWLGIPSVPYTTLYRTSKEEGFGSLVAAASLSHPFPHLRLNCMPLWTVLQNLGHEGVVSRIKYSLDLSTRVHNFVEKLPSLQNVSKRRKPKQTKESVERYKGISGMLAKFVDFIITFEIENPTCVFRYCPKPATSATENGAAHTNGGLTPTSNKVQIRGAMGSLNTTEDKVEDEEEEVETLPQRDAYLDALNIWLCETLRRDVSKMYVTAVELAELGVCIRFAPMESSQMFDTSDADVDEFYSSLERQLKILDATVGHRKDFQEIVEAQDNMQLITLPNWAGLGAVQYIPEEWVSEMEGFSAHAKIEINNLNSQLVHLLKSSDLAFSLGISESGLSCVRFGLITEDTDLEELIGLVYTTGKEVEESSKFLETMAEAVRSGIEKAQDDLQKENQDKLAQEGVLRQVPLVSSFINWWSPPPKDPIKGRAFNLSSGSVESTEPTYRYHMQVQKATPELSPKPLDGPLKANLKPRRSHARSESNTSASSADTSNSHPMSPLPRDEPLPEAAAGSPLPPQPSESPISGSEAVAVQS